MKTSFEFKKIIKIVRQSKVSEVDRLLSKTFNIKFFMYAIVEIAGQQFKVEAGNEIFVNRLPQEKGASVEFTKVLLVDEDGAVKVGAPYVEGVKVTATVLGRAERGVEDGMKGDKVLVFKKKRRKGYQKLNGYRHYFTKLQIDSIA